MWTHNFRYAGVEFVELGELYRTSDVVSLHLGLGGDGGFRQCRAILINTARCAIVHEEALIHALTTGRSAGACLDVVANEPLPRQHPLTLLGNVVLTPHCAGITPEALEAGLRMAVENIWDFLEGRTKNQVGGGPNTP